MNEDKARNRFMRLRYKEGSTITDIPDLSIRQLATELGLSAGAISKLESESLEDCKGDVPGSVPSCNAATLKRYHDRFKCSYEYLMGETAHKTPEYYNMGKDPVLGLFDDSFFDNLKELLNDKGNQQFNLYMLQVFMSDPKRLQDFMEAAFRHLYDIYVINIRNDIKKTDKERITAPTWFFLYSLIKEYFEVLIPKLEYEFHLFEEMQAVEREIFAKEINNLPNIYADGESLASDSMAPTVFLEEGTEDRE